MTTLGAYIELSGCREGAFWGSNGFIAACARYEYGSLKVYLNSAEQDEPVYVVGPAAVERWQRSDPMTALLLKDLSAISRLGAGSFRRVRPKQHGLLDHGADLDLWRVGFTVSNPGELTGSGRSQKSQGAQPSRC